MSTTTTTVEAYLGATQFLVTQIAKFHPAGGVIAAATSSYLLGEVSLAARITDLAAKLQDGTATGEDVAQVFSSTASVLAGCNILMVGVTPLTAGLLTGAGAAAGVLYLYQTFVPEETKQAVWEGMFKTIFESPFYEPHSWNEMQGINLTTATSFLAARTVAPLRHDPLILDLDGDGLETIGINPAAPILFDHDGDGVKTTIGWVKSDDAFLVLDRNGNGAVDNGSELFGDATPLAAGGKAADGFAALAQEDTNHDGKVDSLDARFANLRLWRDLNQDGISQNGELFTLASQGITALNVARTANATLLANGNRSPASAASCAATAPLARSAP